MLFDNIFAFGSVLRKSLIRKRRALHFFQYCQHRPLASNEALDIPFRELDLRFRDLSSYAGR